MVPPGSVSGAATQYDDTTGLQTHRYLPQRKNFLYKHGADIFQDTPDKHDLLMGVGQKLPTIISVAMASEIIVGNFWPTPMSRSCLSEIGRAHV